MSFRCTGRASVRVLAIKSRLRPSSLQELEDRGILSVRLRLSLARGIIRIGATSEQFLDDFDVAIPDCLNERGHTRMVFNLDIDMRSVLEDLVEVVEVTICGGFPES